VAHLQLSGEVHFFHGSQEGEPYQLAALPLYDARNEPAGVAGFFLDVDNLRRTGLASYLGGAIRAAEGRFAPDFGTVLTLLVRDEKGRPVYVHRDADAASLTGAPPLAEAELADLLPGWKVTLAYVHASDAGWMRRIVGIQVVLLVLASSLVLLGTILSMRFVLRQMELAKLKSYFVSNITHELKTPLAAIRLYTETLQEGRVHDRAESEKFLGVIHRETVRLTQLISNILEFSSVENGKHRYAFEQASVGGVVREVLDAYGYQLRSNGFDVRLEIEADLPESRIDRNALGQALLDLLDNAMKYSGDRKEIVVGAASRPNDRSENGGETPEVLLWVSDRGVGIPPGEERKIFEPFYRVQKGLEHDVKGSGLGLAVAKQIVEAHGGTIEVESRPGQGSTFTIRLMSAPR
jgi:signal transduction histidine kinase